MSQVLQNLKNPRIVSQIVEAPLLIGTHNGSFHCDEVLAVSMLKFLPAYAAATIVRSRDPSVLAQCHCVVDVGAVYDAETHRYDHHQREFTGTLDGYSTKLSSAGLVYKHFGKDIINAIAFDVDGACLSVENTDTFYDKIYKGFMEHIDAIDNGVEVSDGQIRYHISTTLSSRVGHINPSWNEEQTSDIVNGKFAEAMQMAGSEFYQHVRGLLKEWLPARSYVEEALAARHTVHPSGSIVVLSHFCPWKDHLFELEETLKKADSAYSPVLYVLYGDSGGSWRIQAVPVTPTSFSSRRSLPASWCGLRDDALSTKTGIANCIFIHASGFIGGNKNKDGCVAMAISALTAE